jgi:hypothetical protein
MKKIFIASTLVLSIFLVGCANTVKPINQVQYYSKPSKEEAMDKINGYLKNHLIDPYSAQIRCSDVTDEAWIWKGVGYDTDYGYLVICQVNSKNSFGAYAGAERFVFRFNGSDFEYHKVVPRMGLMSK